MVEDDVKQIISAVEKENDLVEKISNTVSSFAFIANKADTAISLEVFGGSAGRDIFNN
jgi:hypothetical protein